VYARLSKRLRATGLASFRAYRQRVDEDGAELVHLINAITTNLTAFFREPHHFTHLQQVVIPDLMARDAGRRRLRIWSAGCSSGEEAYSIAMALLEALPQPERWDIKILATDLDSTMVARAEAGIYPLARLEGIGAARCRRWIQRGVGCNQGLARMAAELRGLIRFRQLNLMEPWPMRQPFDLIFCRNVVIYFDKPTQRRLFERYAQQLTPQGWLYIGHSESLHRVSERFVLRGKTIYQKAP